jgi:hypothetical protein
MGGKEEIMQGGKGRSFENNKTNSQRWINKKGRSLKETSHAIYLH